MAREYRHNHYVPVWYQKRFLPVGQANQELFLRDLKPPVYRDSKGKTHPGREVRPFGFRHCFAEDDLYTTRVGLQDSTAVERLFFGAIDNNGRHAVEYFAGFSHPSVNGPAFQALLLYMSTQKLRTPKGLGWLAEQAKTKERNALLALLLHLQQLYAAIWAECVWLIADASESPTKFIISDHPVTVYNRRCSPRSDWCRGYGEPDIRFHATQTIFPLSLEKILILTNLSWVRNPYQSETKLRPNPAMLRGALFNFTDIQTLRHLSEQEVREINFIIKSRALRYIAAAQKEWLFPEQYVSKSDWKSFGGGYLLMPDPRSMHLGGEVIIGWKDGSATGYDEYGRRPWEPGYATESRGLAEAATFYRFQGEFARLFGPRRRGRSFETMRLDPEVDDAEFHQSHLDQEHPRRGRRR